MHFSPLISILKILTIACYRPGFKGAASKYNLFLNGKGGYIHMWDLTYDEGMRSPLSKGIKYDKSWGHKYIFFKFDSWKLYNKFTAKANLHCKVYFIITVHLNVPGLLSPATVSSAVDSEYADLEEMAAYIAVAEVGLTFWVRWSISFLYQIPRVEWKTTRMVCRCC